MAKISFAPNPAQKRFLRAFRKNRTLLLCSGVGVGKTHVLCFAAFRLAWLNPGVSGLVVSHILSHVRTEIVPRIISLLKESGLYAGETRMDRVIHLSHGGSISYGSADRPDSLDGKNCAWLVGDEIRYWNRAAYDKATARVRERGANYPMQVFCSTPEMNWMYDEFADRPDRTVIYAKTIENKANLQAGYYERLKSTLSAGTYEQYAEGKWRSSSGSVYGSEYSEEFTVDDLRHVKGEEVVLGMDPGVQAPAVLFCQRLHYCHQHNQRDCLHILDELVPDDTPLSRMLPLVVDKAERRGFDVNTIYLDPFGGNSRDQVYGLRVSDVLEQAGFKVEFSYDPNDTSILNGIEVVRSRLLSADGQRRLYIDRSLMKSAKSSRNVARAIASYRWPERKPGKSTNSNPIHDETSHVMDALRYVCVNLFPFSALVRVV